MGAYLGNTEIGQMYLGSTEIAEAYLGSTKVYQKLPYDAQVEYLQSSGTQYIDTGFVPNNESGFYVRSYCSISGGTNICLGVRENSSTQSRWWINFSSFIEFGWNEWESSGITNSANNWVEVENNFLNKRVGKIDGINRKTKYSTLETITRCAYIFGTNLGGDVAYSFRGKISNVKISQGTEIVMDFIPVRVGSTGYMYDKVSNQLFGNAGTGSFTLGNDITT